MQQMQSVFTRRMEPVPTHGDYPKYARSGTKPVVRARHIIDRGDVSDRPCAACVALGQACYRWEGTFSKCAYCTSKDRKRELCRLPGQEEEEEEGKVAAPGRRKRRKITGNIYAPGGEAASTADTTMSGTFVSGTLTSATTLVPDVPLSSTRNERIGAPNPAPVSAAIGIVPTPVALPPPPPRVSEAGSVATLERVTALEGQVSGLEAKVVELLVRLEEVNSCVSAGSTPRRQAFGGDPQARRLPGASSAQLETREWVEGPRAGGILGEEAPVPIAIRERVGESKTPSVPEYTAELPEGYMPIDHSCAGLWSLQDGAVTPDAGAEANAFSSLDMASRGNLF